MKKVAIAVILALALLGLAQAANWNTEEPPSPSAMVNWSE